MLTPSRSLPSLFPVKAQQSSPLVLCPWKLCGVPLLTADAVIMTLPFPTACIYCGGVSHKHRIVLHTPFDLPLNVWYLDDGTLMSSPEDLTAALSIIESVRTTMGLHLNHSKSLLFILREADTLLSSIPAEIPTTCCGFSLLGCTVGSPDYYEEVFQARLEKLKASLCADRHG